MSRPFPTVLAPSTPLIISDSDASTYLAGLNYGLTFGAEYEELQPIEVNTYVAHFYPSKSSMQAAMNNIGAVQSALISNDPSNNTNCKW